jgi:Predicted transcriptional regulators
MVQNKLLEIRLQRGYKKQKDFAEFLGMSQQDYNKLENNKKQVSIDIALDIASKLNIHVEDIFYKSDL